MNIGGNVGQKVGRNCTISQSIGYQIQLPSSYFNALQKHMMIVHNDISQLEINHF